MTTATSNTVRTGTFHTHYLMDGPSQSSEGPIVLLHGGGAGADGWSNWRETMPLFAQERQVLAVDLVGFGRSDKPAPESFVYSQDARNEQLVTFIEALGLRRVTLVGNSMGGATALGVAMRRPELVENLVLMGSAGIPITGPPNPALAPMVHYDFTIEGMRKIVEVLANPGFHASDEQIHYRYELAVEPDTRAAYTATMRYFRENGFGYTSNDIRRVKTRTLIVQGKDDLVVPVDHAYTFLELLENSTGYIIPQCRHWAMLEYPDLFASITLEFLDRYRRARTLDHL